MVESSLHKGSPRIDVHCHVIPEEFWKASDDGDSWFGASLVSKNGSHYIDADARFAGPVEPNWRLSVDERISLMDSIGVDIQVVSTPPYFFNYHLPAREGEKSARTINEGLLDMVSQKPDRFSAFATLPFQDVNYAVKELEWAMASGMKGAELCTHVNGLNYDDESLWPVFEAAEDLGAFLSFPAGLWG
jgi:aminocarboxymuconate-semialdehyde decarboxylase